MTADQRTAVAEQLGISPSVLAGLDEPSRSLPGEAGGHSVYQITFANGATYVGSTGGRVLDRLEQHFGADPGQPAPSITVAAVRGLGTFAIVSRAVAGHRVAGRGARLWAQRTAGTRAPSFWRRGGPPGPETASGNPATWPGFLFPFFASV